MENIIVHQGISYVAVRKFNQSHDERGRFSSGDGGGGGGDGGSTVAGSGGGKITLKAPAKMSADTLAEHVAKIRGAAPGADLEIKLEDGDTTSSATETIDKATEADPVWKDRAVGAAKAQLSDLKTNLITTSILGAGGADLINHATHAALQILGAS